MPLIGRINDINKKKFKSKSFHGHLFVVDGISVGEEFLDPDINIVCHPTFLRFSGVPASGQQCTFFAVRRLFCNNCPVFQGFQIILPQVGTSIVNGLWYGADCDETPMFGVCEIEPL